jgi:hypothetical protein
MTGALRVGGLAVNSRMADVSACRTVRASNKVEILNNCA